MTQEQLLQFESVVDEFEKCRELTREEKELLITQIMSDTFMDLRCDWALKHVLRDKVILKMLLNDVLPEEIDEVEFAPNEVDRFFADDKNATMDVICHSKRPLDRTFIVEIQQKKTTSLRDRMLFYGAATLTKQVRRGQSYKKLNPVYVICFLDATYKHTKDQLVYKYAMREETTQELLGDLLNVFFFELPRLKKKTMKGLSPMESWLYLLKNLHNFADIPEGMDQRFNPVLDAARMNALPRKEQLQYLRAMLSEDIKQDYYLGGYEEGVEVGMEKGLEKGRNMAVKLLVESGMDAKEIALRLKMEEQDVLEILASRE